MEAQSGHLAALPSIVMTIIDSGGALFGTVEPGEAMFMLLGRLEDTISPKIAP